MEAGNKVAARKAKIIEKLNQLREKLKRKELKLRYLQKVVNLKQDIEVLKKTHAAELAKYAVKSNVDINQTPVLSKVTETLEEVRITDPLRIPEVLEMILNNLKEEALREVRSVCKLWNETCVRIVLKEPFVPQSLDGDCISKLNSILSKSLTPEAIIQKVFCKGSYGDHFNYEENLQELLKKFGHKVKVLDIIQEKRVFSPLKSILIDSGEWCQNLEELNITVQANAGNFQDFILKEDQLSRLKRLTFHSVCTDDDKESRIPEDKHLFSMLIKASPNLECLTMGLPSESDCKNVKVVTECVNSLTACPEMIHNLKEFRIRINSTPEFNPFQNLFHSKIQELLKKLGGSLERLTIWGVRRSDVQTEEFDWPVLPKLKYFKNYGQDTLQLELVELNSKMPVLEELILAGNSDSNLINKRCLKKLFDIEKPLKTFHHLTLKNLTIFGKIYSNKTPAAISRMFPNISKLAIYIYPHKSDMDGEPHWFQETFQGLLQMKRIKNLTLCLRHYCFDEALGDGLTRAFKKLKNLPDLRLLTLISDSTDSVGDGFKDIVSQLLSNGQGLKRLKLVNFTAPISTVATLIAEKDPDTQLEFADEHGFLHS